MTTGSSKANDDRPSPARNDTSLTNIICNQVRTFISQHHHDGNPDPERTRGQVWDLASAVKHIAEQYAVDHPSHSLPVAGPADDDVCFDSSFVSSTSATFDQGNPDLAHSSPISLRALHQHIPLTIITDGSCSKVLATMSLLTLLPLSPSLRLYPFTMGRVSSHI